MRASSGLSNGFSGSTPKISMSSHSDLIAWRTGRSRPILLTAIFTGLRSSELRGLRWVDVDLDAGKLHVRQRADRFNQIGRPKSESGDRSIPLGPLALTALKQWKLACPKGEMGLVFPNGVGKLENHANIVKRILWPVQIAAGVTVPMVDKDGKPETDKQGRPALEAKYSGLHALRHFYASWCINRRRDGGLEIPMKTVQERMGHSSIVMTSDIYGHLFPQGDDGSEMVDAEKLLMA